MVTTFLDILHKVASKDDSIFPFKFTSHQVYICFIICTLNFFIRVNGKYKHLHTYNFPHLVFSSRWRMMLIAARCTKILAKDVVAAFAPRATRHVAISKWVELYCRTRYRHVMPANTRNLVMDFPCMLDTRHFSRGNNFERDRERGREKERRLCAVGAEHVVSARTRDV